MKSTTHFQVHEFEPIFDEKSKILVLGTFPSVKSRENHFYYGHPQNRFWRVLSAIFQDDVPSTIHEKKAFLLRNNIAIWDVIASCKISGPSDSSITDVIPVEIEKILSHAPIAKIYANGNKAKDLYEKYLLQRTGIEVVGLPSTSPANARFSLDDLIECWRDRII